MLHIIFPWRRTRKLWVMEITNNSVFLIRGNSNIKLFLDKALYCSSLRPYHSTPERFLCCRTQLQQLSGLSADHNQSDILRSDSLSSCSCKILGVERHGRQGVRTNSADWGGETWHDLSKEIGLGFTSKGQNKYGKLKGWLWGDIQGDGVWRWGSTCDRRFGREIY